MRFVHVLAIVLTELSLGSLLLTAFVSPRAMPGPFYTVNSLLGAVLAAIALLFAKIALPDGWWAMRFLGLTVIAATLAFGCYRLERHDAGRFFLLVGGLVGLLLGLLPLADRTLAAWRIETKVPYLFGVSTTIGALLLGSAYAAMFLSQWYGMMRGGYYENLERLIKITLALCALRTFLLLGTVFGMSQLDPKLAATFLPTLWAEDVLLFIIRVAFGLVGPMFLTWQAFQSVQLREDPPPLGKIGAIAGSVFVGELFAAYLLI